MIKLTLFSLILVLTSPFSGITRSISSSEQAEQTEIICEVLSKSRQRTSILALPKSVQKSQNFKRIDPLKLVIGIRSRSAKTSTPIYLRKCTLLI